MGGGPKALHTAYNIRPLARRYSLYLKPGIRYKTIHQLYMVNRECESVGNPRRVLYRIIIKRLFARPTVARRRPRRRCLQLVPIYI